ncbi:MAG: galactokinase [Clostridia bacterium]|nr:galactokinase [Clostridia bacterium]
MFDINKFKKDNAALLDALYASDVKAKTARIARAAESFAAIYGDGDVSVFSVSGRSEICGNHTDHNRGEVFAASIDLDIIAVVRKTDSGKIRVKSEGFDECVVDLSSLSPVKGDEGSGTSLIRGVCDGFVKNGHKICAFDCYTTSDVRGGSGLSSSAAFEDMIGTILNHFENGGNIGTVEISQISQYAENAHFGKPCGLMDQIACASGGFVNIDFKDLASPVCKKIDFDIDAHGYALCIVWTGGNHADLTDDYASVPAEMKKVASFFGKDVLRDVSRDEILENVPRLREFTGDRAILRALHFVDENARVEKMRAFLEKGDADGFLSVVRESGRSSAVMLQNYFSTKAPEEQGITLAYAVASEILDDKGAVRVHGGGFAGTIQAFVPKDMLEKFKTEMERSFGKGCVTVLRVRPYGAVKFK